MNLEFAIPLLFIALIVPVLDSRPAVGARVTAGAVAVLSAGLPSNLGLIIRASAGILAGVAGETRWVT